MVKLEPSMSNQCFRPILPSEPIVPQPRMCHQSRFLEHSINCVTINSCPIHFPTPSKAKHTHTSQSPLKTEVGKIASSLTAIGRQQYKQRRTRRFVFLKPSLRPSNKWSVLALFLHDNVRGAVDDMGAGVLPRGGNQGR